MIYSYCLFLKLWCYVQLVILLYISFLSKSEQLEMGVGIRETGSNNLSARFILLRLNLNGNDTIYLKGNVRVVYINIIYNPGFRFSSVVKHSNNYFHGYPQIDLSKKTPESKSMKQSYLSIVGHLNCYCIL